ncbi:unnamed protein product [Protopolystoma xenopodis]|uniref:Uncharacterized protein n=1 Tax=Protopolystoma xenopodis TaxID=117903 RepID=A0A448XPT1_9PLAT|nr:unnamed protein product [Protopolystoma xenopodis]
MQARRRDSRLRSFSHVAHRKRGITLLKRLFNWLLPSPTSLPRVITTTSGAADMWNSTTLGEEKFSSAGVNLRENEEKRTVQSVNVTTGETGSAAGEDSISHGARQVGFENGELETKVETIRNGSSKSPIAPTTPNSPLYVVGSSVKTSHPPMISNKFSLLEAEEAKLADREAGWSACNDGLGTGMPSLPPTSVVLDNAVKGEQTETLITSQARFPEQAEPYGDEPGLKHSPSISGFDLTGMTITFWHAPSCLCILHCLLSTGHGVVVLCF